MGKSNEICQPHKGRGAISRPFQPPPTIRDREVSLSLALKPQYAISPCSKLDEKEEETAAAVVSYIILLEKSPFFSSRREKRQTPGSRRVASAEAKHVRRPNKLVAD
jgi:hypothetical protein